MLKIILIIVQIKCINHNSVYKKIVQKEPFETSTKFSFRGICQIHKYYVGHKSDLLGRVRSLRRGGGV